MDALDDYDRASNFITRHHSVDHPLHYSLNLVMGRLYSSQSNSLEALSYFKKAENIALKTYGGSHSRTLEVSEQTIKE